MLAEVQQLVEVTGEWGQALAILSLLVDAVAASPRAPTLLPALTGCWLAIAARGDPARRASLRQIFRTLDRPYGPEEHLQAQALRFELLLFLARHAMVLAGPSEGPGGSRLARESATKHSEVRNAALKAIVLRLEAAAAQGPIEQRTALLIALCQLCLAAGDWALRLRLYEYLSACVADRAVDYVCAPCLAQLDSLFAALDNGPAPDLPALRAFMGVASV